MISEKVTEIETKNEIKKIFKKFGYVLDSHGAVGLVGLKGTYIIMKLVFF